MTNFPANHRTVIVIDDTTLRGYAKLALLHAEVSVSTSSVAELAEDLSRVTDAILLLDAAAHTALVSAASEDAGLARRMVLFDPAAAVGPEQRQYAYGVLDRVDAEWMVRTVRDCLAAFSTASAQQPEEAAGEPANLIHAAAEPVKKAARKIFSKKPKRRR